MPKVHGFLIAPIVGRGGGGLGLQSLKAMNTKPRLTSMVLKTTLERL